MRTALLKTINGNSQEARDVSQSIGQGRSPYEQTPPRRDYLQQASIIPGPVIEILFQSPEPILPECLFLRRVRLGRNPEGEVMHLAPLAVQPGSVIVNALVKNQTQSRFRVSGSANKLRLWIQFYEVLNEMPENVQPQPLIAFDGRAGGVSGRHHPGSACRLVPPE